MEHRRIITEEANKGRVPEKIYANTKRNTVSFKSNVLIGEKKQNNSFHWFSIVVPYQSRQNPPATLEEMLTFLCMELCNIGM